MTGQDNILRNLQDHEVPPPPELRERLEQLLKKELDAAAAAQPGSLERLSRHGIEPPDEVRVSIANLLSKSAVPPTIIKEAAQGGRGKTFSFFSYRVVAACLLLVVAGWGIYRINTTKKNQQAIAGNKSAPVINTITPVQAAALPQAIDTGTAVAGAEDLAKPGTIGLPLASLHIDGQRFTLLDNDLFGTFTSFEYDKIPEFITRNNNREVRVHLDQYDNLLISQPMAGMLKDMYQLKPDGKPTRKARKRRERLNRWKKTDESYFDQSPKNNPLDPIDLGRFIFK